MEDSFEELRTTSVDNKIQISNLLIRTKQLEEQSNIAKKEYLRLEVNYTKLLENNRELKETITQNKQELNLKELEINKIKEAYEKIKEEYSAAMISKQKQIEKLEREVEAKELQAQNQKKKFIQLQSELETNQEFKKNIFESICVPDMALEEKFSQLSIDLEKAMEKEIELTKTIQKYKQDILEKDQQLKKSKAKYVKIQVDHRAQMDRKEQQVNGFREIISKYRESRGRIKLVIQLEDAIKREYTEELNKIQEKDSIAKTRQGIDGKLYKIVQSVGKIAESERFERLKKL